MAIFTSYILYSLDGAAYRRGKTYRRLAAATAAARRPGTHCLARVVNQGAAAGSDWAIRPPVAAPVWVQGADRELPTGTLPC